MKLCDIKGFGEKRIAKLASCGIYDPLDLLMLFPVRYYDRREKVDWENLTDGDEVIFKCRLIEKPVLKRIRKGLSFVKARFDAGREVTCTWFNQDYVFRQVLTGGYKLICGKVKRTGRHIEISAPQLITERDCDVMPIYKLPKGMTQTVMYEAVKCILSGINVSGYIPERVADKYGLTPLYSAFRQIHFPDKIENALVARRSIALENLAYTLSVYNIVKDNTIDLRTREYTHNETAISEALKSLPYSLTADQAAAVSDIIGGLHSARRLNVLLQGDVGSGKTIVAFLAMYYAVLSGYQCAIMAPTELLARQHYNSAVKFFFEKNVSVGLLVGSQTNSERERELARIAGGQTAIAVGTHAVIGKEVTFKNLGLTVTDEQHRFGVCQRGSLENKTAGADNIVMSATPIPRTLALTLYGELKTIILNTRPNGENNIITAIVHEQKLINMYNYIENKAHNGEKTYIVCPRVDSDDTVSAVNLYNELRRGPLKNVKLGLLHGQQKEKEKIEAMRAFAEGDVMVLVSTTVIEVGIDVKSATTMVIFGADYFGLSQLHQLRGRIGRDGRLSYCFIVQTNKPTERLKFLCECADGFKLAEYDFDARGAGDFLGTRQHGKASAFAGVKIDAETIKTAKAISSELLCDEDIRKALSCSAGDKSEFIRSLSMN